MGGNETPARGGAWAAFVGDRPAARFAGRRVACGSALASLPGSGARAEGTATAGQGRDAEPGTRGRRQKPRPSGAPGAQRRDRFLRHVVEGRQREAGALSQRNKVYLQLKQYLPKKKNPTVTCFSKFGMYSGTSTRHIPVAPLGGDREDGKKVQTSAANGTGRR